MIHRGPADGDSFCKPRSCETPPAGDRGGAAGGGGGGGSGALNGSGSFNKPEARRLPSLTAGAVSQKSGASEPP